MTTETLRIRVNQLLLIGRMPGQEVDEGPHLRREMMAMRVDRIHGEFYRPVFGQQDSTIRLFKLEPDGKYANAVKVALGKSSVSTIEIKDGLKVGDVVILSDMSTYDSYDRIKLN